MLYLVGFEPTSYLLVLQLEIQYRNCMFLHDQHLASPKTPQVFWQTSQGTKTICHGCYKQLTEREEVAQMRAANQKAGIVPKGFGLGLTGVAEMSAHIKK